MSEPTENREPDDVIVDGTITSWKKELTVPFDEAQIGPFFDKKGVLPEEIFDYLDKGLNKIKESAKNPKTQNNREFDLKKIENNEMSAANNFQLMFNPEYAQQSLEGKLPFSAHGVKPFYINSRFNNAWNRMCELFPDDVRRAILLEKRKSEKSEEIMTQEESTSLNKLALHLMTEEGVDQVFLTR